MSYEEHKKMLTKNEKLNGRWKERLPQRGRQIQEAIEKFEEKNGIKMTGIYDTDGLSIGVGFKEFWLDEDILGAYTAQAYHATNQAMEKILAIPHANTESGERLVREHNLRRDVELIDFAIYTTLGTLLISPFPQIGGFIVLFIENIFDVSLAKQNLPTLKQDLLKIIRE